MAPESRDSLSLETLFVRFRDHGDASAFAAVFDRAAPALLAVARRIGRRRSDAEDLLQATFVTAIERAATFDPTRSVMAWLVGILALHAKNAARRAAREAGRPAPEIGRGTGLLQALVDLEERAAVARAIDELPQPYRETLASRLAHDSDAGPRARLPTGGSAIRMRVHRALAKVRRLLPSSFLGASLVMALERRALARVRAHVFENAAGALAQTTTMAGSLAGGALFMSKKIAAAAVAVLLAAAAWIAIDDRTSESPARDTASTPDTPVVAPGEPATSASSPVRESVAPPPDSPSIATGRSDEKQGVRVIGRLVDASDGSGIADAECIVSVSRELDELPRDAKPGSFAKTDATGRFEIPSADYERISVLNALPDDYARSSHRIVRPPRDVAFRDGIDLGEIRLVRGATVRGRVIDVAGVGAPDATLILYDNGPSFPISYVARGRRMGKTNADGSFAIDHVPPSGAYEWRLFATSARGFGATSVDVLADPGTTVEVEVRLVEPARLDVDVVDPEGSPVEGAHVAAVPIAEPYVMNNWTWYDYKKMDPFPGRDLGIAWDEKLPIDLRVTTGATGLASFTGFPAALPCTLAVAKKDHVPFFADIVKLDARTPTRVRAVLAPMRSFPIAGRVVDPQGKPLPGVAVERYGYYHCDLSPKRDEVVADGEGRFRFEANTAGSTCHLCVGAPRIARRPLEVEIPADRGPLDLELVAIRAVPIAGEVVDASGAPIAEAFVAASQDDAYVFSDVVRTDSGGRFRVSNATAGSWRLTAVMPGEAKQWRQHQIELDVEAGDTSVKIVGERDIASTAEVSIEVVDAISHEPLEPREALCGPAIDGSMRVGGGESAAERRTGLVRFENVKPGKWRVRVKCDGRAAAYLDVDVLATDTVLRRRIEVPKPARVRGRIVAPEMQAAALRDLLRQAVVQGTPQDGLAVPDGEFDPARVALEGRTEFEFTQVPPGPIAIQLWGELTGDVRLDAKPGEEHTIEIHARRPGLVRTIGASDYPAGTLTIRLTSPEHVDGWFFLGYVGADASDQTLPVQPGTWRWSLMYATSDGRSRSNTYGLPVIAEGSLDVRAGETTDLKLPPPR